MGDQDGKQAASLAGLAACLQGNPDAGPDAPSFAGGLAGLHQALYMPALVAARFNPAMKTKYRQLLETGKPAKIAITAIMRKLIVLANALLREKRNWTEIPA
ncbi:MAG: hypothetical protein ACFCUR_12155 [Rhodomicrobiaceae bacterium]